MGALGCSAARSERVNRAAGQQPAAFVTGIPRDQIVASGNKVPAAPMSKPPLEIISESAAETAAIGEALAGYLRDGDVVLLHGDLGAGKTTLAKGIASALGIEDIVSSPSFSLVNEYDTGLATAVTRLYHLDLYRLRGEVDLASIGFDDFMAPADGITLVEWPERAATALPERFLLIEIETVGPSSRRLRFVPIPNDETSIRRIENLRSHFGSNVD
jgi:tRNA threonylcarbamoyladenosine biosynthesis protein TsaE